MRRQDPKVQAEADRKFEAFKLAIERENQYRQMRGAVRDVMAEITVFLAAHDGRANKADYAPGFHGDLSYVLGELQSIRSFLRGDVSEDHSTHPS